MPPRSAFAVALVTLLTLACSTVPPAPGGMGGEGGDGSGGDAGAGGTGGDGAGGAGGESGSSGQGGAGGSSGLVFACTEQGVRDAIEEGGGPHTFDCLGPTRIVTSADFFINQPVILDGEGNLILDGDGHRIFELGGVSAELRGITMTNAGQVALFLPVGGNLTVRECAIVDNAGNGAFVGDRAELRLVETTIANNEAEQGAGINVLTGGIVEVSRSTISSNDATTACGGLLVAGSLTMTNSTVSGNTPDAICGTTGSSIDMTHVTVSAQTVPDTTSSIIISVDEGADLTITNSILFGACKTSTLASGGHNIESPFDSCGLRGVGDQVEVTSGQLNLGALQANGGPTETHEPGAGRAIDTIDPSDCELANDQRGVERPQGDDCDRGSVEVTP